MLESSNTDAVDRIQELESALRERDDQLQQKDAQLEAREQRIRLLEEALRYLKADKYGASREKLGEAPGQRGLFNEVETIDELMQVVGVDPPLGDTLLSVFFGSDIVVLLSECDGRVATGALPKSPCEQYLVQILQSSC